MTCIDVTLPPSLKPEKYLLVAAALILDADSRILLAQRAAGKINAGLWEFSGGKVEIGETAEETLRRELKEELGISTQPSCLTPVGFASLIENNFYVLMPLFALRNWEGTPQPLDGQQLKWVRVQDLRDYPMSKVDIALLNFVEQYLD